MDARLLEMRLSVGQWLTLSWDLRGKLKEAFNIPRSKGTYIEDNKVISDGHTEEDLLAVNISSMQAFTQSDSTDYVELFNLTVNKLTATEPEETPEQNNAQDTKPAEEAPLQAGDTAADGAQEGGKKTAPARKR